MVICIAAWQFIVAGVAFMWLGMFIERKMFMR